MRITKQLAAIVVSLVFAGCVSYSSGGLTDLSNKNIASDSLTSEMCLDFAKASAMAANGDDRAFFLLGKAYEMQQLSILLQKHSSQCFAILKREEDFTEAQLQEILENFKRSWNNAKSLAR